ncbi:S-methyl-5'-thioadenosine phosphorylase [Aeromicrobium sp. CF4.19]|uniref:S-methyl-5'-thioadenosine phosphorylase n=1 Tax=Aeromicrobium sp. CF4.19 TaxID=3373082 RepID=UPI003EE44338
MTDRPDVAVIGGSGFYTFLDDAESFEVDTPYGKPSAPVVVGTVDERRVAFLPRHGRHHDFPAHQVPYRANLWALRSLGVRQVLAPCAVGSLKTELGPGSLVVPDQLVDRTTGRAQTYFDSGACHISFADPYCDRLRGSLLEGLAEHDPTDGGAMVVIDGPRFSTRAESQWYAAQDWSLVNMTGHPEAVLARELALCYAAVALVTDHDAGVDAGGGVSQAEVFKVFGEHTELLRSALRGIVSGLAPSTEGGRDCACPHAVDGMDLPVKLP